MTNLKQPRIALGTWAWGDTPNGQVFGNHLTTTELQPVVDAAMAAGLTLWDTAYAYGAGASEEKVGELLQAYPARVTNFQRSLHRKWPPELVIMKWQICWPAV